MQNLKSIMLKLFFLVLTITIMVYNFSGLDSPPQNVKAVQGYLDLSQYDFDEQGKLFLDGEWQFYHNQLIEPANYSELKDEGKKPDVYIKPPKVWNYYKINEKPIPGFGYGTYRMIVTGVIPGQSLAIKVLPLSTTYRIYIDDRVFAENGVVSQDSERAKAVYHPETISFIPERSEFVITLHISNFIYARGGMWDAPTLATTEQIEALDHFIHHRDWFLLGCYGIMFLLCMVIYFNRPENRCWLYFALLCFSASGRLMIYGEHLITQITENFRVITFIEYATRYWYPVLFLLFANGLFDGRIPKRFLSGLTSFMTLVTIATAILPISIYTSFARAVMAYDLILGLILFVLLLYPGQRFFPCSFNKIFILYGLLALAVSVIYDMFFAVTAYLEMTPIGFFVAILAFAFILAMNYTEALDNSERALKELEIQCELKLQTELKLLQSQIRPHFLYNALSAIANVCKKDGEKAEQLILDLAFVMQNSFDFNSFDKMITLESELEYIHKYVEIEQARFGDKIRYKEAIQVPLSIQLPRLIIEPLVENSIRHGISKKKGGGEAALKIYETTQGIQIEIYDNGIGMSEEKMLRILSEEESDGIGLKNIHDRLARIYGTGLKLDSVQGEYMKVSFIIRKENDGAENCSIG